MRISQSEIIAKKITSLFNSSQFENAVSYIRKNNLQSCCYLALQLLYSCTSLSSYRYVVRCTDGFNSITLGSFDNVQDLYKYCKNHSIDLGFDVHKLSVL